MEEALIDDVIVSIFRVCDPLSRLLFGFTSKSNYKRYQSVGFGKIPESVVAYDAYEIAEYNCVYNGLATQPKPKTQCYSILRLFYCFATVQQYEWAMHVSAWREHDRFDYIIKFEYNDHVYSTLCWSILARNFELAEYLIGKSDFHIRTLSNDFFTHLCLSENYDALSWLQLNIPEQVDGTTIVEKMFAMKKFDVLFWLIKKKWPYYDYLSLYLVSTTNKDAEYIYLLDYPGYSSIKVVFAEEAKSILSCF